MTDKKIIFNIAFGITACSAEVHDGLFAKPSDTGAITEYLEQNGLI